MRPRSVARGWTVSSGRSREPSDFGVSAMMYLPPAMHQLSTREEVITKHVPDVVRRVRSKDVPEALGALGARCREPIGPVRRLLAMADQITEGSVSSRDPGGSQSRREVHSLRVCEGSGGSTQQKSEGKEGGTHLRRSGEERERGRALSSAGT